jgi:8-oxo-dGTP pyrophosphatase MutT (NUDIX family)
VGDDLGVASAKASKTDAGTRARGDAEGTDEGALIMTAAIERGTSTRTVYFHDSSAPRAEVVVPSVFVAVTAGDRVLLVRRCDSGMWELPGGRVDVGETAVQAAVRETFEEAAVHVVVTDLVGLFTDPGHVVRSVDGNVRQQFVVVFRARAEEGTPHGDMHETNEAAWVAVPELSRLAMEQPVRLWIATALSADSSPHLG